MRKSVKDLEKGVETCVRECDEGEIQLLEDRSSGKFIYFFPPYVFWLSWIFHILIDIFGAGLTFSTCTFYLGVRDYYYDSQTEFSEIFSISRIIWLIIDYFLYFAAALVTYIHSRNNVDFETKALQKLLEEVAGADLTGDPEAWRRIAFRVNQCFMEKRYDSSIVLRWGTM